MKLLQNIDSINKHLVIQDAFDGFRSSAGYFPEDNVAVANTSKGVVMPISDILIGISSHLFWKGICSP